MVYVFVGVSRVQNLGKNKWSKYDLITNCKMQNCANNVMQKNKYTPYFSTDKASTFAVSVNLVLHCQGEIALCFML